MLEKGFVQVYTGNGKGKTTAALGLALRAAGHGLTVHIVQFMKGWPDYGELKSVKALEGVTLRQFGRPEFVDPEHPDERDRQLASDALEHAREVLTRGGVDVLILDEANVAVAFGLIDLDDLLGLIELKPPAMELVITGRQAAPEVIERADLVTEMRELKHPFRSGILGRKGIEF